MAVIINIVYISVFLFQSFSFSLPSPVSLFNLQHLSVASLCPSPYLSPSVPPSVRPYFPSTYVLARVRASLRPSRLSNRPPSLSCSLPSSQRPPLLYWSIAVLSVCMYMCLCVCLTLSLYLVLFVCPSICV